MKDCFWVTPLDKYGRQSGDAVPVYKTGYFRPEISRFRVALPFQKGGHVRVDGRVYKDPNEALAAFDEAAKNLL